MYVHKAQNANASKITVTTTATNLFDLINTAGGTNLPLAGYPGSVNALNIQAEDGDIRFLMDGNTPTSTLGFKLSQGTIATLRNVPLTQMKLISASGGDVVCSVEVGTSDIGENSVIGGSGGASLAYDATSSANRVDVVNPSYLHFESNPHFIDVSNIADTTTHYEYLDRRTFKNTFLQFDFGGTDTITVKVAGSAETDVDMTSATYVDMSNEILGASSITTDKAVSIDTQVVVPFLRVEYTSNNLSSDGSLKVSVNQM